MLIFGIVWFTFTLWLEMLWLQWLKEVLTHKNFMNYETNHCGNCEDNNHWLYHHSDNKHYCKNGGCNDFSNDQNFTDHIIIFCLGIQFEGANPTQVLLCNTLPHSKIRALSKLALLLYLKFGLSWLESFILVFVHFLRIFFPPWFWILT